jgi:riboflavin biosynthesis pyrimidine reductase
VRKIHPARGPDLEVIPRATAGPLPPAVATLASYYGNGAARLHPVLRANMVTSADGAVSVDGRSRGLSGPADRMLFTVLRSMADVILVGAGTVRVERYRPVQADEIWTALRPPGAPVPAIAVVSGRLNLEPGSHLLTGAAPDAQTIVITTAAAPADRRAAIARHARVIEAGRDQLDLAAAVAALRSFGYANIVTEGGPTLLGQLAEGGLLDELCLTTSPLLTAGHASRSIISPAAIVARMSLAHVLTDSGFLFSRYRYQPEPETGS